MLSLNFVKFYDDLRYERRYVQFHHWNGIAPNEIFFSSNLSFRDFLLWQINKFIYGVSVFTIRRLAFYVTQRRGPLKSRIRGTFLEIVREKERRDVSAVSSQRKNEYKSSRRHISSSGAIIGCYASALDLTRAR